MDAAPTLAEFFAAWDLFRAPALTGALAGMMLGCLGVYVVLRRMVFLAATVSAASFGVALAYLLGLSALGTLAPTLGALVLTFITLYVIASDTSHEQHRRTRWALCFASGGNAGRRHPHRRGDSRHRERPLVRRSRSYPTTFG